MGLGTAIFLLAVGAILAFAVDYQLGWLDLTAAGWVLMCAGALGLLVILFMWNRRRSAGPVA